MDIKEIADRYFETRGCRIKRSYQTKSEAKAAAKLMTVKTKRGRIRAYSCQYCDYYHIGHIRPSYEDRRESKRIEKMLKNAV